MKFDINMWSQLLSGYRWLFSYLILTALVFFLKFSILIVVLIMHVFITYHIKFLAFFLAQLSNPIPTLFITLFVYYCFFSESNAMLFNTCCYLCFLLWFSIVFIKISFISTLLLYKILMGYLIRVRERIKNLTYLFMKILFIISCLFILLSLPLLLDTVY